MHIVTSLALVLGLCLVLSAAAFADNESEPITTDRPDFTEAAVTVRTGELQIESGATAQWFDGGRSLGFPEALFRYGLSDTFEARFLLPDYNLAREDSIDRYGFGDIYVGVKYQLGPLPNGDDLSIIPALTVSSGENDFSNNSSDPEVKICYARDFGEFWSISAMAYPLWTTINDDRSISYQQTISLGRDLVGSLAGFVEYAGTYAEHTAAQQVAHAGFAYGIGLDAQADLHGGLTMNGSDRDPFIGIGYSIRFR